MSDLLNEMPTGLSKIINNIDNFKNAIDNGFKYEYSEHYSDDYPGAKIETVVYVLEKDLKNNRYNIFECWDSDETFKLYTSNNWEELKNMLNDFCNGNNMDKYQYKAEISCNECKYFEFKGFGDLYCRLFDKDINEELGKCNNIEKI